MPVPTTSQVTRGAPVSIVLKADQRTGREVQGVVQDVLTKGNHPRGIKVRLADGRIGRVQRMDSGAAGAGAGAQDGESTAVGPSSVGFGMAGGAAGATTTSSTTAAAAAAGGAYRSSRLVNRYSDVRNEDGGDMPPETLDLAAYIKAPKQNKKRKQQKNTQPDEAPVPPETQTGPVVSCPVCSTFHGDEAAVAHHVETHFT